MANYQLSDLAEEDLGNIADTTIEKWVSDQAQKYIHTPHTMMLKLAETLDLG